MVVYTELIITGDSLWWDFNKFLFFYSEDYAETPELGKKKEGKEETRLIHCFLAQMVDNFMNRKNR